MATQTRQGKLLISRWLDYLSGILEVQKDRKDALSRMAQGGISSYARQSDPKGLCKIPGLFVAAPFYMITSGDLIRFIWVNPKWSFHDTGSILANGAFLMGSGLIFGSLLFLRHRFWRAE